MGIRENYQEIVRRKNAAAARRGRDPEEILLLAVTKLHSVDEIDEAIEAGATDAGENRVQELLEKYGRTLPVRWHLIGHLQTNKVRNVIGKVVMIHSVDSYHLAREIDKRSGSAGLVTDILIEINSAMEESKSGIAASELDALVREITENCEHLRIRGLMCIPPIAEDPEDSRPYFRECRQLFEALKASDLPEDRAQIDTLSMGMSGDFEVAI